MKELTTELVKSALKAGEVYTYKQMAALLEQEEKRAGNPREGQYKIWDCYFKRERIDIQKFRIVEIYELPIAKEIDGRKVRKIGNNFKLDERFMIPQERMNSIGVYKIVSGKDIYIGSTTRGFRERFRGHRDGCYGMEHTKKLLDNGGIFDVVEYMDGADEDSIRKKEEEYIHYYLVNPNWNSLNKFSDVYYTSKKQPKEDLLSLKVLKEDYHDIMKLLNEHGYSVTVDKRYKTDEV